jgi:hypothetical protein
MSVAIGAGYSVVIRKSALREHRIRQGELIGKVGDLVSEDESLVVLGPLFETQEAIETLSKIGLEYFEDFFDIPHNGGPVAEWCQIELRVRTGV